MLQVTNSFFGEGTAIRIDIVFSLEDMKFVAVIFRSLTLVVEAASTVR